MMPSTTITPISASIPDFTVTPTINTATFPEDIDQYNSELPGVIDAQQLLTTQLNTFITQVGALEDNVIEVEAITITASDIAVAAANFQGTWSGQLTALKQSWVYAGRLYAVLVAGTDSPATTPSNWFPLNNAESQEYTPSGYLEATTVQSAIDELEAEKISPNTINAAASKTTPIGADKIGIWDSVTGLLKSVSFTNLWVQLAGLFAPIDSPAFTGTPAAPTATAGTVSFQLANLTYVDKMTSLGTLQSLVGLTSLDYVIPTYAKKITVSFDAVSLSGTSNILVQIGTGGVISTTGYGGSGGMTSTSGTTQVISSTAGFVVHCASTASAVVYGNMELTAIDIDTGRWVEGTKTGYSLVYHGGGGGSKTLGAPIDILRITTVNGTDTFDGASAVNILVEY